MQRTYLAIDLKSYYASAECCARHLDPLTTNLVVADASRTEKTICLAVSPSLKAYGIPGRARRMASPPLHLLPMTPPLSPLTRPLQSIILSRLLGWRTMKRYLARSTASI